MTRFISETEITNEALDHDLIHMHQALELARIRRGFCSPNPSVGAVIVNPAGEIMASGYHHAAGSAHAEIVALQKLADPSLAREATIYITLEPCCHWGKTPPCTDALIKAGIKRVVYGYIDPNSKVSGKGKEALQAAGILCDYLPTPEVQFFYASYHHWVKTQLPYVTAKIAMSINGKIAGPNGERIQITGEALQEFTHYFRKHSDAILTTAKTIQKDDPQLNARYQDEVISKPVYILDSALITPITATVLKTAQSITIFHSDEASLDNKKQLEQNGVRCINIGAGKSFKAILETIGNDGIHDLWVEAGGTLFSSLLQNHLLQHAFIYIAPKWINEGVSAFSNNLSFTEGAQWVHWEQMGNDVLCEVHWYTA